MFKDLKSTIKDAEKLIKAPDQKTDEKKSKKIETK